MNWHTKNAWGGYTVDSRLWQFPGDSFGAIKVLLTVDLLTTTLFYSASQHLGLHMGVNLHDDDGIGATPDIVSMDCAVRAVTGCVLGAWEATFEAACSVMGLDPVTTSKINFTCVIIDVSCSVHAVLWHRMVNATYLYGALEDTTLDLVRSGAGRCCAISA